MCHCLQVSPGNEAAVSLSSRQSSLNALFAAASSAAQCSNRQLSHRSSVPSSGDCHNSTIDASGKPCPVLHVPPPPPLPPSPLSLPFTRYLAAPTVTSCTSDHLINLLIACIHLDISHITSNHHHRQQPRVSVHCRATPCEHIHVGNGCTVAGGIDHYLCGINQCGWWRVVSGGVARIGWPRWPPVKTATC